MRLSGEPVTVPHLSGGEIAADVRTGTPQDTGGETIRHGRGRPSGGRSRQTVRRERLPIVRQTVRRYRARAQAASRPAADRANLSGKPSGANGCGEIAARLSGEIATGTGAGEPVTVPNLSGEIATGGIQERHRRRGKPDARANPSGANGRKGGRLRRVSGDCARTLSGRLSDGLCVYMRMQAGTRRTVAACHLSGRRRGRSDAARSPRHRRRDCPTRTVATVAACHLSGRLSEPQIVRQIGNAREPVTVPNLSGKPSGRSPQTGHGNATGRGGRSGRARTYPAD